MTTADTKPVRLVLPILLDIQPILLTIDVTNQMSAQIQSFCRNHKVTTSRCVGTIQESLDEVVNLSQICKKPRADHTLPGFMVTKNVLRKSAKAASAS